MNNSLAPLNKAQQAAVSHRKGPLLVVAGAGTGKTTVLVRRLADILATEKLNSDRVLLLTFTEKAAAEMEERADMLLPYGYLDLWISTFHSFCERVLREHALDIGLPADFKLLSSTEQWILMKKNLEEFDLNYYRPLGNPNKFIGEMLKHFSKLKDENISSQQYLDYAQKHTQDSKNNEDINKDEVLRVQELAGAYARYNQLLLDASLLDFGDLITYTLQLFQRRPQILAQYREQFVYIMVDEFQDTNWAQYELVKLLAAPNNNLMVVGDDDQAIYRFRGASLANIMQFKEDFPTAGEVILTDNYRSRQDILDIAHNFIKHNNPNRLEEKLGIDKQLKAKGKAAALGQAPQFILLNNQEEELSYVAENILQIYQREQTAEDGVAWSDFAILARSNDTAENFVKELTRRGIPNQFVSLRGLYYKSIILDSLAYLRLLDNYHESSALFRVLNITPFRISHADIIALNRFARRKNWSLFETLKKVEQVPDLSPEAVEPIKRLITLVDVHSALVATHLPSKIFFKFVEDSGLIKELDINRDQELFSHLNQFYQKMKSFEDQAPDIRLPDFMAAIDLELEAGDTGSLRLDYNDADTVKIMTIHAAKGLEFPYVFLVNLADKKFPTINRSDKIALSRELIKEELSDSKDDHLEEERRLFYVALTRAKKELYLTSAKDYGGVKEKKVSRFIEEAGFKIEASSSTQLANELVRDLQAEGEAFLESAIAADKLPDKFSFSQLAAYETCPLQYKYAFVLKIPAPDDKPSLTFGRVMHNVFCDFLKPLISGPQASLFVDQKNNETQFSLEQLKNILAVRWQDEGYQNAKQALEYKRKAGQSLQYFYEAFFVNGNLPEPVFLEKNFSFKIGGETLKGAIDRVDRVEGGFEVIDYKTGAPKEKLDWQDKRQLILYQLFLEEVLQMKVLSLKYYYVENASILEFLPTEKEKDKLKTEVIKQIAAIKSRNFSPKPSMMCKFCDFNKICEFRQN